MTELNTSNHVFSSTDAAAANVSTLNTVEAKEKKNWYEAMATAWGETLNKQADVISDLSDQIGNQGQDDPKTMTLLTAQSMRMGFIASNASTSTSSVGKALETLARKG